MCQDFKKTDIKLKIESGLIYNNGEWIGTNKQWDEYEKRIKNLNK